MKHDPQVQGMYYQSFHPDELRGLLRTLVGTLNTLGDLGRICDRFQFRGGLRVYRRLARLLTQLETWATCWPPQYTLNHVQTCSPSVAGRIGEIAGGVVGTSNSLKAVAQTALYRTGLTDWMGGLGLRREAGAYILFGHRVVGHDDREHICARQLSSLLGYLRRHFDVIPLADVLDRLHTRAARAAVALTFDDGYADNYQELLPILRAHQVPATVFVTSGPVGTQNRLWVDELRRCVMESAATTLDVPFLDGARPLDSPCARRDAATAAVQAVKTGRAAPDEALRQVMSALRTAERGCTDTERMLSWQELRELAADPLVTIGVHTVSHPILANLPLDEACREIDEAREKLADAIGHLPEVFAYPNGQPEDIPPGAVEHLRRSGWKCAVTTVDAIARRDDDPMLLPRLPLGVGPRERLAWSLARAAHRV